MWSLRAQLLQIEKLALRPTASMTDTTLLGGLEPHSEAQFAGDLVHTYSGDDSGHFPFEAEDGHNVGMGFLIFAFADKSQKGRFAVDNCGNSTHLSKATSTIAELEQLPSRHGGLLYGEMYDGDEGASIVATGPRGTYTTVSGPDGKFSISIPPGTYAVTANKAGHAYNDMDIAYKQARNVTVPDGGSAGLTFREKGK
jgi:hypothetical protein